MCPDSRISLTDLYFGSVSKKQEAAHILFRQYGSLLQEHHAIQQKLYELLGLSRLLSSQMASMDMNTLCVDCGSKPGGGCCSSFMAGETDGILLLINLILGVDVKAQRDDDIECCYLGKEGCILKVKPVFCLNYNCWKILQGNPGDSLHLLDKAAAGVLWKQVEIEESIIQKLTSIGQGVKRTLPIMRQNPLFY